MPAMDYHAFRRAWDEALHRADLLAHHVRAEEGIDLASMTRTYSIRLGMDRPQPAEPFWGSMEVRWKWDALKSARTRTTEEDLLTELLGKEDPSRMRTDRPWLRVDVRLDGKLSWDRPVLLPASEIWRGWVTDVIGQLEGVLPEAEGVPIQAWRGEPEAEVRCGPMGELWLLGVSLESWQAIELPRHWDNPERKPDVGPEKQLEKMAKGLHGALAIWKKSLKGLLPSLATMN